MPERMKSTARRIHRACWMAKIRWAMNGWYRSKKRTRRRFDKLDRMMWRYNELFGECDADSGMCYTAFGYNGVKLPPLPGEGDCV